MELIDRQTLAWEICKAICGEERGLCVSQPKNCQQRCMKPIFDVPTVSIEQKYGRLIDVDAFIDSLGVEDEDLYCKHLIENFYMKNQMHKK